MMRGLIAIVLLAAVVQSPATPADAWKRVADLHARRVHEVGIVGSSLLFVQNREVAYRSMVGYQDLADRTPIDESTSLPALVADTPPGQTAKVRLWRDGKEQTLSVKVSKMPGERVASNEAPAANSGKLGVVVRPLSAEERSELHANGLFVENAGGAAAEAGLQPGDVILALNDHPVRSARQLSRLVRESPDGEQILRRFRSLVG